MKLADFDIPPRASWIARQGLRLDASPYLSGSFAARTLIERLPLHEPLNKLTAGHDGGIFNGPKFARLYTHDPQHGVPFLGSTDMLEADLTHVPLLNKEIAFKLPFLRVEEGMTMISCSGTIGRMAFVRPDMDGFWSSQHTLKVNPDRSQIAPGYLNAFLQSDIGRTLVVGHTYGAIIQHIEPQHLVNLPIPRFEVPVEERIDALIQDAAALRADFQNSLTEATQDLFASAGVPELAEMHWHGERDLGFSVGTINSSTFRAMNFSPRSQDIISQLQKLPHKTLGHICQSGELGRGNRFTRVDSDPEHGYRLVGQRQAFWLRPEGRWIALKSDDLEAVSAQDESILIASQGTLGENEVFCRPIFVTGRWQNEYVFSEHFLRVASGDPEFPGAYLFAFLRSEAMFRVLRSMSAGSKQQDIHEGLRWHIPVPECTPEDRERIAETVRQAYRWRDEADMKEDEALNLLDQAIREAAR